MNAWHTVLPWNLSPWKGGVPVVSSRPSCNEILLVCAVQNGSLQPQMAFWVLEMWLMSLRNWFLHFRLSLNSYMWAVTAVLDRVHPDSGWHWARSPFWIWRSSVKWSHLRTLQLGTWCLKTGFPCWSLRPLEKIHNAFSSEMYFLKLYY